MSVPVPSPFGGAQGADAQAPWFRSFLTFSSVFSAVGMFSQTYLGSSITLLILGSVIEVGRRSYQWLMARFRIRPLPARALARPNPDVHPEYSITARFDESDPAYEWVILFLVRHVILLLAQILTFRIDSRKCLAPLARVRRQRRELAPQVVCLAHVGRSEDQGQR